MPAVEPPSQAVPKQKPAALIGVIDLLRGVAVRAVAGRRSDYRPIRSRLCDSPGPCRIASAFRERYGVEQLYIADLDAILGTGSNTDQIAALAGEGFRIAVDAGIRRTVDVEQLPDVVTVVAGLETLASPLVLAELVETLGPARVVFSLDLADGVPLADPETWGCSHWTTDVAGPVVALAVEAGIEQMIVLDLRTVGTSCGPATLPLCRQIRRTFPGLQLWTGGGVRTRADVASLAAAGVEGVLVASALHDETY